MNVRLSLADQLAEAKEKIRELEDALRPVSKPFYRGLSLPDTQSILLGVLIELVGPLTLHSARVRIALHRNVDSLEIGDTLVYQAIYRLRVLLKPAGIHITNVPGAGFYLDKENKAKAIALRIGG